MFTVINEKHDRVSMHATRMDLLARQADAAGLPLRTIRFPDPCTMEQADAIMREFVAESAAQGIQCMAFGDLFLEDVRAHREGQLRGSGIEPRFPLWGIPTRDLAAQMLAGGLEAFVSCVDLKRLPARFAGRKWAPELLAELPPECDPCGENGEMHTVCVGGPMYAQPVPVTVGAVVEREGFAFADIVPDEGDVRKLKR